MFNVQFIHIEPPQHQYKAFQFRLLRHHHHSIKRTRERDFYRLWVFVLTTKKVDFPKMDLNIAYCKVCQTYTDPDSVQNNVYVHINFLIFWLDPKKEREIICNIKEIYRKRFHSKSRKSLKWHFLTFLIWQSKNYIKTKLQYIKVLINFV